MNISSRCDYACRALLELAGAGHSGEPLPSVTIADRRKIPEKYLVHILLQLKRAGLVRSVRGAQGGYVIARAPEEMTLLDIVEAIDGPVMQPLPGEDAGSDELRPVWRDIAQEISDNLRNRTLRDVMDNAASTNMYYI